MKSTRPYRWAPAHPEEAEDRGSGPYDVIVLVLIIVALIVFFKIIFHGNV